MIFISRIEAYTFTIYFLNELKKIVKDKAVIDSCIDNVRIAIENHELDSSVITRDLRSLKRQLASQRDKDFLDELLEAYRRSRFDQQTMREKLANPLRRRFESELAVLMLKRPTRATMQVVGRISSAIVAVIDENNINPCFKQQTVLDRFLSCLLEEGNSVCLGAFKRKPALDEIKTILIENRPDSLAQIMQIHYRFARYALRNLAVTIPYREPCGRFAELIEARYGSIELYAVAIKEIDNPDESVQHKHAPGYRARGWIADEVFCRSPLYINEPDRGRQALIDRQYTNQLGLMQLGQDEHAKGLPREQTQWLAECDERVPRLESRTVRDYLNNDAIYVTGPSGMTSLLLGQMEVLGNFESEILKQHYLPAVIAYIAASGFHSLHEILGPAQYALNLVPGYEIQAPDVLQNKLAPAPHYHHYFALISIIDGEFAKLVEDAWQRYLVYFEKIYLQQAAVSERLQGNIPFQELMELVKAADNKGYTASLFQIKNLFSDENELPQSLMKSPRQ